jgi:hypothetical protein
MKKIFYMLLIVIGSSLAITSCTEEEVTPVDLDNGGTGVMDPKGSR